MIQNKLKYLMLTIGTGLIAVLYNEYHMGILFMTVLFLPFVLLMLNRYLCGRITVQLESPLVTVKRGENIPITIHLKNTSYLPATCIKLYLTYKNAYSEKQYEKHFMVSIDYKSKAAITYNMRSDHVGNLELSIYKIKVYDYFKISALRKKQTCICRVSVLPEVHELEEEYQTNYMEMEQESDVYSKVRGGDDPSEVFEIREYREGDRPSRIHWKLSRKQEQLMMKEFSDPVDCSILIFINLSVDGQNILESMDRLLESALSLSYLFLREGQMHYFAWYDERQGRCRRLKITKEDDRYEAAEGLLHTSIRIGEDGQESLMVYLEEYPIEKYTDVVYVTTKVNDSLLNVLTAFRAMDTRILYAGKKEMLNRELTEVTGIGQENPDLILQKIWYRGISIMEADFDSKGMKLVLRGEF